MRVLCGMFLFLSFAVLRAELPEYAPPFAAETQKREIPVLEVKSLPMGSRTVEQVALTAGNKRVGLRLRDSFSRISPDWKIVVSADGEEVCRIYFTGSFPGNGGMPFRSAPGTKPEVRYDRKSGTITYSQTYRLPDGRNAVFSFTLKPERDGLISLTWDPGVDAETIAGLRSFRLSPVIEFPRKYREMKIAVNGKDVDLLPESRFRESPRQDLAAYAGKVESVTLNGFVPAKKISLIVPQSWGAFLEACYTPPRISGRLELLWPIDKTRRILIDPGAVSLSGKTPPPVAGIDFWKNDAMYVQKPVTRNLLPNPSFDQGLRYFSFRSGGAEYTPSAIPKYEIDEKNGRGASPRCLLMNPVQGKSAILVTAPLLLEKGKTYTVSCYVKGEVEGRLFLFGLISFSQSNMQFTHGAVFPRHKIGPVWRRFSYTFTHRGGAVGVQLRNLSDKKTWVDDLQVEEGTKPTEFVTVPLTGNLRTSDPDSTINAGTPVRAEFEVFGGKGRVDLSLIDFYRKELWKKSYTVRGGDRLALPFDDLKIGTGNFVVQAVFHPEKGESYRDYYRFCVMRFLENRHATKNLFGTVSMHIGRIPRGDDLARLHMRIGLGSTGYGRLYGFNDYALELLDRYRIANMVWSMGGHSGFRMEKAEDRDYLTLLIKDAEKITPADEKRVEEITYEYVKANPRAKSWSFNHELENRTKLLRADRYDEWAKLLRGFQKGVKRARPDAITFPDGGTAGFSRLRGRDATEKFIASTQKLGLRWEAFATHVYWNLDGTKAGVNDLDEETAYFIRLLKKYGYDKEPIYYTEGFNIPFMNVPEWECGMWQDPYRSNSKPTYDFGLREFNQAAWLARTYLICLKYWPRIRRMDFWASNLFLDYYLIPYPMMNAVNTLGNLFGDPVFEGDVRPAAGVRGYVYRDKVNGGVAAIWCVSDKVEDGLERGPVLHVRFPGELPEFIDLMGNRREVNAENGIVTIPLTAAPLFLKHKDPAVLRNALRECEVIGGESNLRVEIHPDREGNIVAGFCNLTGRPQEGTFRYDGGELPFRVDPNRKQEQILEKRGKNTFGELFRFSTDYTAALKNGASVKGSWNMNYFYVPYTKDKPDWARIPALPLHNLYKWNSASWRGKSDFSAQFRLAWNEKNLYLRVEVADDRFVAEPERFHADGAASRLYLLDGCLEVYFDCGANGISSGRTGYDDDDYRYDFSYGNPEGKSGPGRIYRLYEVQSQLAGGVAMLSKEESAKRISCTFTRTPDGYVYDIVFPQSCLEPLALRDGFPAGFALHVHDKDDPKELPGRKGANLSAKNGAHVNNEPSLWPRMILRKTEAKPVRK